MTEAMAIHFLNEAIYTTLLISAPILLAALVIGFMIGVFQAVTSINEMTLTFIPKIIGVIVVLVLVLPWMMNLLESFTVKAFQMIPMLGQ